MTSRGTASTLWREKCDAVFSSQLNYFTFNVGRSDMLWTIFVILLVLWVLGLVSSYTLGGFIHVLLVLALAVLIINLLTGRKPVV